MEKITQQCLIIMQSGQKIGHIDICADGSIETSGTIGENTYTNFTDLIKGLQGFNINLDDILF